MLPPGYEEGRRAGLRVWALRGFAESAVAATAPGSRLEARGRVRFCDLPGGAPGERMAVRHYFRGGILAPLLRDYHLDGRRPLREIELTAAARAAGVPTLEPLAGVARRVAGPIWRCDLITRAVPGARDLGDLFAELRRGSPRRRARVLAAAGRAVRALHEAGFEHSDLNLKNLLVADGFDAEPRVLVIDLDGARRHPGPLGPRGRRSNLLRLHRSSQKLARLGGGAGPSLTDLLRFARAYAGGDEAELRALAGARLPRHRLRRMLWTAAR